MLTPSSKQILLYSFCLGVLMYLLNFLEYRYMVFDHSVEIFTTLVAVLFMGLGIWLALKLRKPKVETRVIEKPVYIDVQSDFHINTEAVELYGLSKRELEVLQLMAEGLSNEEIAEKLFVSLPTVKSHASRLFGKMDVKRRTQAIEQARKERIIF